MRTLPTTLCVLGLTASSALGGSVILLDQIGSDDGASIGTNGFANQYFAQPVNSAYNVGCVDDFDNASGLEASSVQTVIFGYNGYVGIDGVSGFQVNFYTSQDAAGVDLIGDVSSEDFAGPFSSDADWSLTGYDRISLSASGGFWATGVPGLQFVSAIPTNEFGTNGQTAQAASVLGDGRAWQANPNGGFGFGAVQLVDGNLALAVRGGSGNPCDLPLPAECATDISGPDDVPDGLVDVNDILVVIGTFGATGDGTSRPQGDCAPPPAGDCVVDVTDVLACIAEFGTDCRPRGACCFGIDGCTEDATESDCLSQGGEWLGEGSSCETCIAGACCLGSGGCVIASPEECRQQLGNYLGDNIGDCTSCPPLPANDRCSGAIALAGSGGSFFFDNTNATTSVEAPLADCGESAVNEIYQDLWYSITSPINGNLVVSTCNATTLDTVVAVYDSCGGTQLGCNDDGVDCSDFTSLLTIPAVSGETYLVRIGSFLWNETASFNAVIEVSPEVPGACCLNTIDCFDSLLASECDAFGGTFAGENTDCSSTSCGWPGCQSSDTPEGVPCRTDTDAAGANADPNGGTNVDPPAFGSIAVGETICGETSTFLCAGCADDGSDATFRDTDWYRFADGNPDGGIYTVTGGGEGPLVIGVIDIANVSFVSVITTEVLNEGSLTVTLPAGDNYAVFVSHDFNGGVETPCSSGLTEYSVTLSADVAPVAACCVDGVCIGDLSPADCLANNGSYIAGESCAAGYACASPFVGCLASENGVGEEPLLPNQSWTAGASDATFNYNRYAATAVPAMTGMRVWGLTLAFDSASSSFGACTDPDMTFAVGAYLDDGTGLPGGALAETSLQPLQQVVDLTYAGVYPLRQFDFDLAASGDIRWVKAASESENGLGDCWLLWMSSSVAGDGVSSSIFDNSGTVTVEAYGLAHCVYQP